MEPNRSDSPYSIVCAISLIASIQNLLGVLRLEEEYIGASSIICNCAGYILACHKSNVKRMITQGKAKIERKLLSVFFRHERSEFASSSGWEIEEQYV